MELDSDGEVVADAVTAPAAPAAPAAAGLARSGVQANVEQM
jgi:hypothetical protein